jgi:HEAT repeat protein
MRADAAWGLGEMDDKRASVPLLQAMNGDQESDVRLNAARALKEIGGGTVPEYKI